MPRLYVTAAPRSSVDGYCTAPQSPEGFTIDSSNEPVRLSPETRNLDSPSDDSQNVNEVSPSFSADQLNKPVQPQ